MVTTIAALLGWSLSVAAVAGAQDLPDLIELDSGSSSFFLWGGWDLAILFLDCAELTEGLGFLHGRG